MSKHEVKPEEILEIKQEYFEKKVIGTSKPVIINNDVAKILVRSRKHFHKYLNSVHESHEMTDWRTEIMAPAGTSRFYKYRECKNCGGAQYYHAAGKFIDNKLKNICVYKS
jgi:hypothetical protein